MRGLDVGTTAAKALDVGQDGSIGDSDERVYGPDADAGTIVEAACALADDGPVCLSSQMHSLIGLDRRDRPVTPLYKWSDTLEPVELPAHLHERTGTPMRPWTPLAKLVALRERGVTAHRWAGVKELIVHRLTGEWVMDHSIASGTGLMALETLDWEPESLELAAAPTDVTMEPLLVAERDGRPPGATLGGLREQHGPGDVVRAALAGVCRELRAVLDALRDAGYEVREVRATGGFARSGLWKQLLADELGMPVGFTRTREGSAYGAALLGLGIEDPDIAIAETIEPQR